jgi:effector-binding domain-containing protein
VTPAALSKAALWLTLVPVATLLAPPVAAVEEAEYSVVRKDDGIEIRDYAPSIVAQTVVDGEFEEAGSRAFRKLFNYIDGDNRSGDEIAMTAPVSQQAGQQKIAMTAPVSQEATASGWVVSFMMPASFTMDTLPQPNDPAVTLREIPAYRAAAVRYSGTWSEENYARHLSELRAWLDANGLEAAGEPVWARYNAPFVPWFMRRNEILIPLDDT